MNYFKPFDIMNTVYSFITSWPNPLIINTTHFIFTCNLYKIPIDQSQTLIENHITFNNRCHYTGIIKTTFDFMFSGSIIPKGDILFILNEDWSVATPIDPLYGWIDVEGRIHKGRAVSGIDPYDCAASTPIGYIEHGNCYIANEYAGLLLSPSTP